MMKVTVQAAYSTQCLLSIRGRSLFFFSFFLIKKLQTSEDSSLLLEKKNQVI